VRLSRTALPALLALQALMGGLGLTGCKKAEEKDKAEPVAVRAAPVDRGDVPRIVDAAGPLEPLPGLDVKLSPLVAGRLAQVLVGEGDRVRAGQTLARLDPTPLRDALAQAEAQLAQARAQESNARGKLDRAQKAFSAGVAAGQEVDDAKLGDASAAAAVRTAQAAVSTARNQLSRSELSVNFAGVVAHVFAAPGEAVDPAKPIIEVADTSRLELRAPLAPRVAALVKPGQPAKLLVDGLPGVVTAAKVLAVAPVVDASTGTALVRIRVENRDFSLKGGSFAHARIEAGVHANVLRVPREALVRGEDGSAVEIVDSGKARRQPVEVGYEDDKFAEIVSGLKGDEQVILQGAYALPDGTPVTATAAAEKSENGAATAKSGDEEKGADPGAEKPAGPEKK
jgi:RND family efflux transporter MFP subunit